MSPFWLSLKLAFWTTILLVPIGLLIGRVLAYKKFKARALVEALVYLPLVLPPTVLGYYLLVTLSPNNVVGKTLATVFNGPLVFSFEALVLASLIVNLPFAVQPSQQAFAAIAQDTREAAWVSGLSSWRTFWRIELPQCWLGVLCAATLTFAHTLGEFGVVLMVGGNIAGETRTLSIAIYDSVQAFEMGAAGAMTLGLLLFSIVALLVVRIAGLQYTREQ